MMGLDNPLHIAFLLVVLLMVFGAKRLPEMGKSLGHGLRGFKDAINPDTAAASTPVAAPVASAPSPVVAPGLSAPRVDSAVASEPGVDTVPVSEPPADSVVASEPRAEVVVVNEPGVDAMVVGEPRADRLDQPERAAA